MLEGVAGRMEGAGEMREKGEERDREDGERRKRLREERDREGEEIEDGEERKRLREQRDRIMDIFFVALFTVCIVLPNSILYNLFNRMIWMTLYRSGMHTQSDHRKTSVCPVVGPM